MKVEQYQNQNQSIIELMQQTTKQGETKEVSLFGDAVKTSDAAGTKSINVKDATYLNPAKEEQNTILEEMEEGTSMDATERKNQMAVLSNTTSGEDYAKMQEEGFSLDATTSNTIVTVTDKIKADHPELPAFETYDELMAAIKKEVLG